MHPHGFNSFPSGHTATAFCFYLLFCLLIFKKYWVYIGCIIAMLVGYSRIYLAQHFPLDVAAGILVAVVSTFLSVVIQRKWNNRKKHTTNHH
jgi:membrane-associated phospholipid phosphatase